jgi:eukaryotic-like serine/threonine-protein kinase
MTDHGNNDHTVASDAPGNGGRADPPRILADRYRLERRIADGGMASVWQGHDAVLARTVAIKVLHPHLAEDVAFRERFRREAVSAAKLTHPNIVSLYDTGTDGDWAWLVMEYVDGATLKDVLEQAGQLNAGRAAAVAEKVARALSYAHARGLVHRDIKPANILLGHDGSVKVADFGIAKLQEADDLTRTGTVLGTAAYVAPERLDGTPAQTATDIYALGGVLFEILTGHPPATRRAGTAAGACGRSANRRPG